MNFIFICASADVTNPIVGDTMDRVKTMQKHSLISKVTVLSLHGSGYRQEEGIDIFCIGSDRQSKIKSILLFYFYLCRLTWQTKPQFFYLYMCPTLAFLVWPFRYLGVSIVQWFGHSIYRWPVRFALLHLSDLWFNSNQSMAPFFAKNLHLVGQGVKAEQFFWDSKIIKKFDIITVGRITPVKKIEEIFKVLKFCKDQWGRSYTLNICGDAFVDSDQKYKLYLIDLVHQLGLEKNVFFSGMVSRSQMPEQIQNAKLFLFLVEGGVGKASLESLACGVPVVISSPLARDFFGEDLADWFLCQPTIEAVAQATKRILDLPEKDYFLLCKKANDLFLSQYTMEKFFDRIIQKIYSHLKEG